MKYRLKKDLPFAKAGSEVRLQTSTANWVVYPDSRKRDLSHFIGYNYEEGDLFDAGWIEEIKPREWNVIIYGGELYPESKIGGEGVEFIRVREVLKS